MSDYLSAAQEAIEKAGAKNLATAFRISEAAVSKWKRNGIPPRRAKRVEMLSGVSCRRLCPEVYGDAA